MESMKTSTAKNGKKRKNIRKFESRFSGRMTPEEVLLNFLRIHAEENGCGTVLKNYLSNDSHKW